jgi:hypothetical protein
VHFLSKQLIVFIENKPGALADLASTLAEAGVNIEAILLEGSLDFGAARIHVDQTRKAEKALLDAGFQVAAGDVVVVRVPNEPGALASIAKKLAKAKVNIESIFGTSGNGECEFVLKVSDTEKARSVLGLNGAAK